MGHGVKSTTFSKDPVYEMLYAVAARWSPDKLNRAPTATVPLFLGRQAWILAESELIVELPGQLAIGGTTIANFYNS